MSVFLESLNFVAEGTIYVSTNGIKEYQIGSCVDTPGTWVATSTDEEFFEYCSSFEDARHLCYKNQTEIVLKALKPEFAIMLGASISFDTNRYLLLLSNFKFLSDIRNDEVKSTPLGEAVSKVIELLKLELNNGNDRSDFIDSALDEFWRDYLNGK